MIYKIDRFVFVGGIPLDEQQIKKHRQMTETPVGPLILRLALPCIVSMLVTAFYNMADTFFVGMLKSNAATGAVGVVFSLMAIIQAIGFFFGQGSGNFISRAIGHKNYEEASEMASTGFFSALATMLIIIDLRIHLPPPPTGTPPSRRRRMENTIDYQLSNYYFPN